MKCRLSFLFLFYCFHSFSQTQTCPVNINFSTGNLTHWYAYTGNNQAGNGATAIAQRYDSNTNAPAGTRGASSIHEYNLGTVQGIGVNTTNGSDPFGNFPIIPTINGYSYSYSIKLGSTSITRGNNNGTGGGGYIRGVSYRIMVPSGPVSEPYTMTYAYAMVLENGTHASSFQPVFSATLQTPAGVVTCASPSYLLPTFNDVQEGGRGATLDSATAIRNGFSVSRLTSPNPDISQNSQADIYLQDVWTKGWNEVTFDLAPYRGQAVSLTFEADNCVPGGHFAYAYVAIRNNCAGLMISGDSLVCNNTALTYSVPALAGATYDWIIPNNWTIITSDSSNIIQVKSSNTGGNVSVREKNSCANLTDTIQIKTLPSPVGGDLGGSSLVCTGDNSSVMNVFNYSGVIKNWVYSTDSTSWTAISNSTPQYTAANLTTTTFYKVVVGKGSVCPPDSSNVATIRVDEKTVGGQINPADATLCAGQNAGQFLKLNGQTGTVQNWQYSTDGFRWNDFNPVIDTPNYTVKGITVSTQYRLIDKNGVCPADTSAIARIVFDPVPFPQEETTPIDTTICFGATATLHSSIYVGTRYAWLAGLTGTANFNPPLQFSNNVTPDSSTDYVLFVLNEGCPNPLKDTIHVNVLTPVIVNAGRDTSVVVGEPMQFHVSSSDPGPDLFSWLPVTELNDPTIADPLATYTLSDNIIKYTVKATTPNGCTGFGSITVKVFKTRPDIFVPNAFTPGTAVNALFRPIPVGISSLDYFRVYNRLGQLVFNTSAIGRGWDGMVNGVPQSPGGYVWMVKGTDYTGSIITKNGTMVLIR